MPYTGIRKCQGNLKISCHWEMYMKLEISWRFQGIRNSRLFPVIRICSTVVRMPALVVITCTEAYLIALVIACAMYSNRTAIVFALLAKNLM